MSSPLEGRATTAIVVSNTSIKVGTTTAAATNHGFIATLDPTRRRQIFREGIAVREVGVRGRQRPLAIAALEDKIVQGACAMVLNAIYEEDFLGFSYGFRPRRGPHDASDALRRGS